MKLNTTSTSVLRSTETEMKVIDGTHEKSTEKVGSQILGEFVW